MQERVAWALEEVWVHLKEEVQQVVLLQVADLLVSKPSNSRLLAVKLCKPKNFKITFSFSHRLRATVQTF